MPSRTVPEKGQMAHFCATSSGIGSLYIFNPQVIASSPSGHQRLRRSQA